MKRALIYTGIFFFSCHFCDAQLNFQSSNQQMIEDAIKDGIYIVEQSYRLRSNNDGKFYGRNNQPEFSKTYSVAIKLNGAYCIDEQVLTPWESDDNYISLSTAEKERYAPVLYKSSYRGVFQSKWDNFPVDTLNCTKIVGSQLYSMADEHGAFGFQVNVIEGLKKGWVVWVTTSEDISKTNSFNSNLNIYRLEIELIKGQSLYEINQPAFQSNSIGGIYVVPEVNRIGQITFTLVGMMRNIDKKWSVVTLGEVKENGQDENSNSELTPINENETSNEPQKKKKK